MYVVLVPIQTQELSDLLCRFDTMLVMVEISNYYLCENENIQERHILYQRGLNILVIDLR